jgi:hypothetical protein
MLERLFANVLSGYLTVCGTLALLGALLLTRPALRLAAGERTGGVIVRYEKRLRERATAADRCMPVFRYVGPGGPHEVQSRVGTTRPEKLPPGSSVAVRYDPADPHLAELDTFGRAWLGPAGLVVLAAGALLGGWKAGA